MFRYSLIEWVAAFTVLGIFFLLVYLLQELFRR
jgi:hypothetical protein